MKQFSLKLAFFAATLILAPLVSSYVGAQEAQPLPEISEQTRFENCLAEETRERELRRMENEMRARDQGRTDEEIEAAANEPLDEIPSKCVAPAPAPAPVEKKGQELEPEAMDNAADAEMGAGGCSMNGAFASQGNSVLFSALWGAGAIALALRQRRKA